MQITKSIPRPASGPLRRVFKHGDRPWQSLIMIASAAILILVLGIGFMLWQQSIGAQKALGLKFILPTLDAHWNPALNKFQAWPFIYGTLITSLAAIVLAVPISLGVAVFLAELCPPWLRQPLNWMVELLAAIPSVVYGLWGIFVFLPLVVVPFGQALSGTLGHVPLLNALFTGPIPLSGSSRLAAATILTIMIVPTITAVTRDVLLAVPNHQREAALALGATRWETIWQVILPYGLSGILGAAILGLGRALGETMAVTMVIGNSIEGSPSLLRPGYTMASIIANEFSETVSGLHTQALVEIGLVLFIITLLLNFIARLLVWRVARRISSEGAGMTTTTFTELMNQHRTVRKSQRKIANAVMLSLTVLLTILALIPLFWILIYVFIRGGKYINLDFFIHLPRPDFVPGGGVLHAIEGTIVLSVLAALFSIPPGVLAAFYAARNPNTPLGVALRFSTDVLSGVPSIVIGLVAYALIVEPQGHYSALAGAVALAILMLPIVLRTTEEMLKLVPQSLREASLALGAAEWKTSLSVLFPAALNGIVTGFLLAVARAAGETAPLLLTALGNDHYDIAQIVRGGLQTHQNIFQILGRIVNQPVDSLPLTLWKYAQQPSPDRINQAWAVALVLMVFVLVINIAARAWMQYRARRLQG